MTARMRRIASDYEEIKKNFAGHKNIIVTPIGEEPPEKYHITYFVNGIYLLPDGKIETLSRHEVEITLHADYPRYKPICKILTPIWHPNFRDGQICIGDIWGAGESLTDIIINIGDMIQYKSWNSYSPLSADAAKWAMENKHLFPVGNINLHIADYASAKETVDIDLFDENDNIIEEKNESHSAERHTDTSEQPVKAEKPETISGEETPIPEEATHDGTPSSPEKATADEKPSTLEGNASVAAHAAVEAAAPAVLSASPDANDFEITAEELEGIEFVPTAKRMQTVSHGGLVKGNKLNFKTVLVKGLLWAIIGAFVGFGLSELLDTVVSRATLAANLSGHSELTDYFEYSEKADELFNKAYSEFEKYCKENGKNVNSSDNFEYWLYNIASSEVEEYFEDYLSYDEIADEKLYDAYYNNYNSNEDKLNDAISGVVRISTAMWSAIIALFIGLFLGLGEGIYYGSKEKAVRYSLIGAGVSLVIGFISGYLAQWMYAELLGSDPTDFTAAFIRGLGWAVMGLGIGAAVGLIKPEKKRIIFCCIGGLTGAFIGGFLFNYICKIISDDVVARGVAIVVMGSLIGVGVGLLEQFAKSAWLKVIRGEFEGKEYLVFAGTTSIGNNGKNTIVLFKDKLVAPHHCDIVLEGSKYVLTDCGTPMGTIVNGQKTVRHILRQGDAIAIGNSVLVFNMK